MLILGQFGRTQCLVVLFYYFMCLVVFTALINVPFQLISLQNTSNQPWEKKMNFVNWLWEKIMKFIDWLRGGEMWNLPIGRKKKNCEIHSSIAIKKNENSSIDHGKNSHSFSILTWGKICVEEKKIGKFVQGLLKKKHVSFTNKLQGQIQKLAMSPILWKKKLRKSSIGHKKLSWNLSIGCRNMSRNSPVVWKNITKFYYKKGL